MIWLLDAVLAAGAMVFFLWDERQRRRRKLAIYRARELEWELGLERAPSPEAWLADVTGSCEITMGPGTIIPYDGTAYRVVWACGPERLTQPYARWNVYDDETIVRTG